MGSVSGRELEVCGKMLHLQVYEQCLVLFVKSIGD